MICFQNSLTDSKIQILQPSKDDQHRSSRGVKFDFSKSVKLFSHRFNIQHINLKILSSEVSLTIRQKQERDSDFISAYQLSVTVRKIDFSGDGEAFLDKIATYKGKERRVLGVSSTPDNIQWIFHLGSKYGARSL